MPSTISYQVIGKIAVISLNNPKKFNSLTQAQYRRIEQLMTLAANDKNTTITLIQSSGKFFSAGATVDIKSSDNDVYDLKFYDDATETEQVTKYLRERSLHSYNFGTRNYTIGHTFYTHPKVFVVALNGPVIGLSAAIVALADIVVSRDSAYLLTPFANLGLPPEGLTSMSLTRRLGHSVASELLLASSPVKADTLYRLGFVNKLVKTSDYPDVDKFNKMVQEWVSQKFDHLHEESLVIAKSLMKKANSTEYLQIEQDEIIAGIDMFAKGYPQERFRQLAQGKLKHRL